MYERLRDRPQVFLINTLSVVVLFPTFDIIILYALVPQLVEGAHCWDYPVIFNFCCLLFDLGGLLAYPNCCACKFFLVKASRVNKRLGKLCTGVASQSGRR